MNEKPLENKKTKNKKFIKIVTIIIIAIIIIAILTLVILGINQKTLLSSILLIGGATITFIIIYAINPKPSATLALKISIKELNTKIHGFKIGMHNINPEDYEVEEYPLESGKFLIQYNNPLPYITYIDCITKRSLILKPKMTIQKFKEQMLKDKTSEKILEQTTQQIVQQEIEEKLESEAT